MHKSYFLGAPSPDGFETKFGELIADPRFRTYILKGGPGTGKSTLMKRLAQALGDLDGPELYFCSSDPGSFDAVVFRGLGIIVADGTPPHVFEPKYPGIGQKIVDLGAFWDMSALVRNSSDIVRLFDENAALHKRAQRCLTAAADISEDIYAEGAGAVLSEKLENYAARLIKKIIPKTSRKPAEIALRQISSVTPDGFVTQFGAIDGLSVFEISDPCLFVTDFLLKTVSTAAARNGFGTVASRDVRQRGTRYEILAIPELGIAFLPSGTGAESVKKINALRFYDPALLRARKNRIAFAASLREELLGAAVKALKEAKDVHDSLEKLYISAMDFAALDGLAEKIEREIRDSAGNG